MAFITICVTARCDFCRVERTRRMRETDIFQAIREPQNAEHAHAQDKDELQARFVQAVGARDWNELDVNTPRLTNFLRREFPREVQCCGGCPALWPVSKQSFQYGWAHYAAPS